MADQPKRRGRPPKPRQEPPLEAEPCEPTGVLRVKDGHIQQMWLYLTGRRWRALPVVPSDAPDWEDG